MGGRGKGVSRYLRGLLWIKAPGVRFSADSGMNVKHRGTAKSPSGALDGIFVLCSHDGEESATGLPCRMRQMRRWALDILGDIPGPKTGDLGHPDLNDRVGEMWAIRPLGACGCPGVREHDLLLIGCGYLLVEVVQLGVVTGVEQDVDWARENRRGGRWARRTAGRPEKGASGHATAWRVPEKTLWKCNQCTAVCLGAARKWRSFDCVGLTPARAQLHSDKTETQFLRVAFAFAKATLRITSL